jgi:hypothetical protein
MKKFVLQGRNSSYADRIHQQQSGAAPGRTEKGTPQPGSRAFYLGFMHHLC